MRPCTASVISASSAHLTKVAHRGRNGLTAPRCRLCAFSRWGCFARVPCVKGQKRLRDKGIGPRLAVGFLSVPSAYSGSGMRSITLLASELRDGTRDSVLALKPTLAVLRRSRPIHHCQSLRSYATGFARWPTTQCSSYGLKPYCGPSSFIIHKS